ncbi:MAG: hypothetical protein HC824_00845 [Synechococcales cyanobacterium RM1_1_8]|nr:hypothetical protein [Synechococcales cyanobacterium RM1_1_8]
MVTSAPPQFQPWPIVLQFNPLLTFDDEQFFDFCQLNRDWQFERSAAEELVITPPTGSETGGYNFDLTVELVDLGISFAPLSLIPLPQGERDFDLAPLLHKMEKRLGDEVGLEDV